MQKVALPLAGHPGTDNYDVSIAGNVGVVIGMLHWIGVRCYMEVERGSPGIPETLP